MKFVVNVLCGPRRQPIKNRIAWRWLAAESFRNAFCWRELGHQRCDDTSLGEVGVQWWFNVRLEMPSLLAWFRTCLQGHLHFICPVWLAEVSVPTATNSSLLLFQSSFLCSLIDTVTDNDPIPFLHTNAVSWSTLQAKWQRDYSKVHPASVARKYLLGLHTKMWRFCIKREAHFQFKP